MSRTLPMSAALAIACTFAGHAACTATAPQSLLLIANGENVGYLKATADGGTYEVDYHVDNNGRGPKQHDWQSELHFGRTDRLGSVHPGQQADLVLLPGDPTADIAAIRQPALAVKDQTLYLPAEIYRALGVAPFAPAPKTLQ